MPDFRPCSTCMSHSQAPLCQCTLHTVSIRAEGTLERLRYLLGGNRPSQTTHQTLSPPYGRLEPKLSKSGISPLAPPRLTPQLPSLPPILHMHSPSSVPSYVKLPGSFCPVAGRGHLYPHFNFAEFLVETAPKSLHHSCGSELTRQGTSLP